jgi:hypothetical protein
VLLLVFQAFFRLQDPKSASMRLLGDEVDKSGAFPARQPLLLWDIMTFT